MAHFAELDKDNVVLRVIVVHNNEITDSLGNEQEELGIQFCKNLFGQNTNWIQTSYNGKFRKNFGATGFVYDAVKDAFYSPTPPAPNMEFDEVSCKWKMAAIPVGKL